MRRHLIFAACMLAGTAGAPLWAAESLHGLYQQAQANDPQFKIAETERQAVAEKRSQAKAGLLPSLNAAASYTKDWAQGKSRDSTTSGYNLTLTQPLYARGNWIALSQADSEIQRAEANYQGARQELMTRLAGRYFDLLSAADNLEFAGNNKAAIQRQLDQTKQRFEVGLIAITDVQESQAGYDLAVAEEILAVNTQDNAKEALREVTGAYPGKLAGLACEAPLVAPQPADIEAWAKLALEQNPQIAAAQAAAELARQEIERQRSSHYPQLDLVARHSYNDVNGGMPLLSGYSLDNSLGVQLSLPLDVAGGVRARTREAEYRHQQALDNLDKQRRAVELQAHQAYLNVISGSSRVKALRQAVVSNRTAYEATQTGFDVGTRTSVDVLNAQKELLRAQRDHTKARYDYLLNTLRLKQAAGSLSEEDLAALSAWCTEKPATTDAKPDAGKPKMPAQPGGK